MDSEAHSNDAALVAYMERMRLYYRAFGYDNDYKWACHDDVPFMPPKKPLAESRVAIITTASPPGGPRSTVQAAQAWPDGDSWRHVYNYVGPENREALRAEGDARGQRLRKQIVIERLLR